MYFAKNPISYHFAPGYNICAFTIKLNSNTDSRVRGKRKKESKHEIEEWLEMKAQPCRKAWKQNKGEDVIYRC